MLTLEIPVESEKKDEDRWVNGLVPSRSVSRGRSSVSKLTYSEKCCSEWFANMSKLVTRLGVRYQ